MSPRIGTFSRRTFLSGASLAAAHVTMPRLPRTPLKVTAYVDHLGAMPGLHLLLMHGEFLVCGIVAAAAAVASQVGALLAQAGHKLPVVVCGDSVSYGSPAVAMVIFGEWTGLERLLVPRLAGHLPVYLDNPDLALRLHVRQKSAHPANHWLPALDGPLDPAAAAAMHHVRSGAMGDLRSMAITIPPSNATLTLEAGYLADCFVQLGRVPVRWIRTGNTMPVLHLYGTSGNMEIPLPMAARRIDSLHGRLSHFDAVARGKAEPLVTVHQLVTISRSLPERFRNQRIP